MTLEKLTSDMPDNCPECGAPWHVVESVHTGDDRAHEGYEDWAYCRVCGIDYFYPQRLIDAAANG